MAQLSVTNQSELIDRLCRKATEHPCVRKSKLDFFAIREAVQRREALSSTAMGGGIAFPHARCTELNDLVAVVAALRPPLDCDTPDRRPIEIAVLLLIPESKPMDGLKFMARIVKLLQGKELRRDLEESPDDASFGECFSELDKECGKVLTAGDLMKECGPVLNPGQPLREATSLMAQLGRSILPVLDGKKLVGEIATSRLLTLGIPDFFGQLKSVAFIRFFDPFEKYFAIEAKSTVGEVMNPDCPAFFESATLIEIVFAISIRKCSQVYIINKERELLGIIDQPLLLERIINL